MKLLVVANEVPFHRGGAEYHVAGLVGALEACGHEVVCLRLPFNAASLPQIESLMEFCEKQNFDRVNGVEIEKVISLQFPVWGVGHHDHRCWVMHQHRMVYELFDEKCASDQVVKFRETVHNFDKRVLGRTARLFSNSKNVASRLKQFSDLDSQVLYHPPFGAEYFFSGPSKDYVFYPSRFESLKRQDMLLEAARYLESPVKLILAGEGPQKQHCDRLVEQYGLSARVALPGRISEAQKLVYYANSLAVFYGPLDEDYGYVTLEAMLSSKPVITTTDSGGPLEFVVAKETGVIVEPEPRALAGVIDELYANRQLARELGENGRRRYQAMDINWQNVTDQLLS